MIKALTLTAIVRTFRSAFGDENSDETRIAKASCRRKQCRKAGRKQQQTSLEILTEAVWLREVDTDEANDCRDMSTQNTLAEKAAALCVPAVRNRC